MANPETFTVYCARPGKFGREHEQFAQNLELSIVHREIGGTGDRVVMSGTEEQRQKLLHLIKEDQAPFTEKKRPRRYT